MRFGWSAFAVPFLFIYSPSLLLEGDALTLIHDIATALGGVWLVSVGIVGYFARRLGTLLRLVFMGAGLLLLVPATIAPGAFWTDIAGLAIAVATVWTLRPRAAVQPSASAE
jgi:TRAP-type uncharacterized transport system fused permease subunit